MTMTNFSVLRVRQSETKHKNNLHEMEVGVIFMLTSDQSRAVGVRQCKAKNCGMETRLTIRG